jgi:predicted unusual protein kinase regulating ubiquinone biosynthesis (AarF/ABC1/UbiB family)
MNLFEAIAKNDGRQAGVLILERSRKGNNANVLDRETFVCSVAELVDKTLVKGLLLNNLDVGGLLMDVVHLTSTQNVRLESNIVKVILTMMVRQVCACVYVCVCVCVCVCDSVES